VENPLKATSFVYQRYFLATVLKFSKFSISAMLAFGLILPKNRS